MLLDSRALGCSGRSMFLRASRMRSAKTPAIEVLSSVCIIYSCITQMKTSNLWDALGSGEKPQLASSQDVTIALPGYQNQSVTC